MGKSHPPYPAEFRAEAVRLVRTSGKSMAQIAREFEVSSETLRLWRKQADIDEGLRHDGLTTEETEEVRRLRREIKTLREEREILGKSRGLLRQRDGTDPVVRYQFIERTKAQHAVALLCRVLCVSSSGYYAWRQRSPSARAQADTALTEQIAKIHAHSRETYGAPRIHAELQAVGIRCSRKRVARLMRTARIVGCHRRRTIVTTVRETGVGETEDYLQRQFVATTPNQRWTADITDVPTWRGFLYLAVVLDSSSRRIVGWAMADHLRTELVLAALDMALWNRRPAPGVIHHSDHGSQYMSLAFGRRCQEAGVVPSVGSRGDCFDNAITESFFATLECELLQRQHFHTEAQARTALFEYIEGFYNPHRRHSALGYRSPAEYERRDQLEAVA
ncbi:MAG TPA: IS3 family transposase [Chloroflexota bacterium]|nr:IS3 family transposase [Chloroflexota bacterium]